ncbi:diguanylate cyclase [Azoarcus sp. L1K30]|uniref:sensor domain-containing diguanylate cyclase n=1 Tax=Azoarcus sp. L1K30 TaxID=2820277 RepID=UPI001B82E0E5|nr:diguanylate cyclase [Azoarcus sp. L1K30]
MKTPGYNCAYLAFNHPPGSWHGLTVSGTRGETIRLAASFLIIPVGQSSCILIGLRPAECASPAEEHFQRFLTLLEGSGEAVMVTDTQGIVEYVNPTYERISGWQRHELVGRRPPHAAFAATTGGSDTGNPIGDSLRTGRVRNGRIRYLDERVRPFSDRAGRVTHYVRTVRDVSRRIAHELALQRRANFDNLTGIANRHLLIQRLNQEISRAGRTNGAFALICADMDRLKAINDTFGHAVGDAAIRGVAAQLVRCVREMDTVGRFGGDEFLLIIPGLHLHDDVDALLGKLVASVRDIRVDTPSPPTLAVSAGAAVFPCDGQSAELLLQAADAAMYKAKRLGGNRYWPCIAPAPIAVPAQADGLTVRSLYAVPVPPPTVAATAHRHAGR